MAVTSVEPSLSVLVTVLPIERLRLTISATQALLRDRTNDYSQSPPSRNLRSRHGGRPGDQRRTPLSVRTDIRRPYHSRTRLLRDRGLSGRSCRGVGDGRPSGPGGDTTTTAPIIALRGSSRVARRRLFGGRHSAIGRSSLSRLTSHRRSRSRRLRRRRVRGCSLSGGRGRSGSGGFASGHRRRSSR
jgi:hypothetical protein